MKKHAWAVIGITLLSWACVNFSQYYYRLGNEAEINKRWDEAITHYEKAIQEKPKDYHLQLALTRVRLSASLAHLRDARSLAAQGKKDEARAAYEKALSYDPHNRALAEELRRFTEPPPKEEPKRERLESPVRLKVGKDKIKLKFPTEVSLRSIFQALGKDALVNVLFDEQYRDAPVAIDISGKTFEEAIAYLCLASKNFYRVIDEKTLIIIPDQPVKRLQYEQNAIKVFFLSNVSAQDVFTALQQMLRSTIRAPQIFVEKNLNLITIRDTPTNLEMAADLIRRWDKPRAEVIVDLEIMEVSRQKLKQIGVDLDDASFSLRYAGPGASEDEGWYNLGDINLGRGSSYQISLPTALIRFLQTSADTKILAQPRLRGVADAEISTVVGQRVPIPTTTFTPIAAGGVSQQPITSFTYEDVGLTIKIKPKIHLEKEVTLEIELKITALAGSGYADLPIIANREIKNTIRLRDGETSLLAGLLRDEERKSMSGVAGLASIPILGRLFSASDQRIDQSDLVLTITPYIIRSLERTAEDEKPLWIELEGTSTAGRGERDLEEEPLLDRRGLQRQPRAEEAPGEEEEKPQETPGDNQISLDPANFEVPQNREFRLSVNVRCQQEIGNISLSLTFNPQVARLKDVVEGGLVRQLGDKVPFLKSIAEGSATVGFSSPQLVKGFRGGGNLAVLVFEAAGQGETRISVTGVAANSPTGQVVNFTARESRVVVR